jgi:hypothetical protein
VALLHGRTVVNAACALLQSYTPIHSTSFWQFFRQHLLWHQYANNNMSCNCVSKFALANIIAYNGRAEHQWIYPKRLATGPVPAVIPLHKSQTHVSRASTIRTAFLCFAALKWRRPPNRTFAVVVSSSQPLQATGDFECIDARLKFALTAQVLFATLNNALANRVGIPFTTSGSNSSSSDTKNGQQQR